LQSTSSAVDWPAERWNTVRILSEKGQPCRLKNPWGAASVRLTHNGTPAETLTGELLAFKTKAGETVELSP
jgi:hypothetical protein